MSNNVNNCVLEGRLTKDPELKHTQSGTALCAFSIAVNRSYTPKDGEAREETCFIDIVVWQRQAEVCAEHLSKGRRVLIEGRLNQQKWEAQDGTKRSKHEIVANMVHFLDFPGNGDRRESTGNDDVPF